MKINTAYTCPQLSCRFLNGDNVIYFREVVSEPFCFEHTGFMIVQFVCYFKFCKIVCKMVLLTYFKQVAEAVTINCFCSEYLENTSGILQESSRSDISQCFMFSKCILYTFYILKFYVAIRNIDCLNLQEYLNRLETYCLSHRLIMNH